MRSSEFYISKPPIRRSSVISLPRPRSSFLSIVAAVAGLNGLLAPALKGAEVLPYAPQYGDWTACRSWGGGYVQSVVLCPSDPKRCYAYVDMAGLYRSDDGGNTWRALHGALPRTPPYDNTARCIRSLSVDPRNANRLVIATGTAYRFRNGIKGNVYLSVDGGASFKSTLTAHFDGEGSPFKDSGYVLTRNPSNPDEITAASIKDGIWRSHDNGETWTCIGLKDTWPTDIRFDISNPRRLWVCSPAWPKYAAKKRMERKIPFESSSGFFRSEDGGMSWTMLSEKSPREILQDPSDPRRLFGVFQDPAFIGLSEDNGETWRNFSDGLPTGVESRWFNDKYSFGALGAGPDFILTVNGAGDVFRLDKGSSEWAAVPTRRVESGGWWGPQGRRLFGHAAGSVIVDPRNPAHWYVTDFYAISQTFDSGTTWKTTIDGYAPLMARSVFAENDSKTVYLTMADTPPLRSDDGGLSFNAVDGNRVAPVDNKQIVAASGERSALYLLAGRIAQGIYSSNDKGDSWRKTAGAGLPDLKEQCAGSIAVHPQDPKRLYVCVSGTPERGNGGVYASRDGGESYDWIGDGLPSARVWGMPGFFSPSVWIPGREIACAKDGSLICFSLLAKDVGLFRWDEKNGCWIEIKIDGERSAEMQRTIPSDIEADPFSAGGFLLAGGPGGALLSDDGGRSWRKILDGHVKNVAFDPNRRGRMAAALEDGVAVSSDGGKTWRLLDGSIPDPRITALAFVGDRLIAATRGTSAFWIDLASSNGPQGPRHHRRTRPRKASLPSLFRRDLPAHR